MQLKDVNALITGGSQGLGETIAEHFVREGASVVLCARDAARLETTCARLRALAAPGQKVFARPCDVSSEEQVNALVAFALQQLGSLQILVNNAGVLGPAGPVESVPLKEWQRALEINLYGVLLPCRAVIPHFKQAGRGKIVILSGGGATKPMLNLSAYAASKAAAVRLMENLALELLPFNIDVNAIAPGAMATRIVDQVLEAGPEKVGQAYYEQNKRWKQEGATPPAKGASLAVYLASSRADGLTGKLISAQWDPWPTLHEHREELAKSDIYTLRRIVPEDRGKTWSS
jgi:3-oxoacyl-[acyl-carrier protein] reductase